MNLYQDIYHCYSAPYPSYVIDGCLAPGPGDLWWHCPRLTEPAATPFHHVPYSLIPQSPIQFSLRRPFHWSTSIIIIKSQLLATSSCGDDNRVMQYLIPCSCAQGAKQLTYTLVVSQPVSQSPIDNRQSMMCPFLSLTHSFCRCFSGVTVCTCCTGALTRVQYVRADKELEETESRWVFVCILKFIANAMIYPWM